MIRESGSWNVKGRVGKEREMLLQIHVHMQFLVKVDGSEIPASILIIMYYAFMYVHKMLVKEEA